MYEILEFPEGKTNYEIENEDGEKTTITLEKWVADILQEALPNVHASIQKLYDQVLKKYPDQSRRVRGNIIRDFTQKEAVKHKDIMKKTLGWNMDDFSESLNLV